MNPYYSDDAVTLYHGDCLDVLPTLPDCSVDAIVTDPPYDLTSGKKGGTGVASVNLNTPYGRARIGTGNGAGGFMGLGWDSTGIAFNADMWAECLRVLKPGGHLLSFGGTRTWHRMAVAIEDAGFEIRDSIAWIYGSGFPKSLDVSKAIDRAAGAEREVVGRYQPPNGSTWNLANDKARASIGPVGHSDRAASLSITAPATPEAAEWEGWGTALKPAFEPVVVARKPLQGTVAANVLAWGTGALNIGATRVDASGENLGRPTGSGAFGLINDDGWVPTLERTAGHAAGRWPANVTLDPEAAAELDRQSGECSFNPAGKFGTQKVDSRAQGSTNIGPRGEGDGIFGYGDRGGASRFFPVFRYEAKAPTSERPRVKATEGGADNATTYGQMRTRECNICSSRAKAAGGERVGKPWPTCGHDDWSWVEQQSAKDRYIAHPTVKPLNLMRWLVRLVTPPGGTVLDPFAGSGTTGEACVIEGFNAILIEREADHLPLITQRLSKPIAPVLDLGGIA